jgi:cell division protein ZapA
MAQVDSDAERKTVRVTIFNQTYTMAATGTAGEVEALAHSVDDLMTSVAQRAGNMDSQRIAVLACLHMADRLRTVERELSSVKERIDGKSRELSLLLDQAID